jgi:hypothetical protein
VLGEPTAAHRVVEALTEPGNDRVLPGPGRVVVASLPGSGVADIAAALADSVGGRYVQVEGLAKIGPVCADADHVALVALAGEVSERELAEAHDSLWQSSGPGQGGHFGLVTGESRADVAWLIAKGATLARRSRPGEPSLRVWSALQSLEQHPGGRLLLADQSQAEVLIPLLTQNHWRDVSFLTHGRDDTIIFRDSVVCSTGPLRLDPGDQGLARAPVCAFTGQCYRPDVEARNVIMAGQILADAVFANTCMSLRLAAGLFPARFLLPHGFVRGAAAGFIGSAQVVNGFAKLADIFHAGCAAGATLGEVVTVINDHLRYERLDLPYFTLLGLPWIRVADPGPAAWDRFDRIAVSGTSHWGPARATALSLAARERGPAGAQVLVTSPRSAAITGRPEAGPDAGLDVPDLSAQARSLGRSMTSLDDVPHLGLRYSRHGNVANNIRAQVTSLASALSRAALAGDTARLRRRLDSVARAVDAAELGLAEAIIERGTSGHQTFNDLWGERFELDEPAVTGDECPYCGRLLVRQDASHSVFARLRRTGLVCPRCSMIQDIDAGSPVTAAGLGCAEAWPRDSIQSVRLTFQVDRLRTTRPAVAAAVFVANAARIGVGTAAPELVPVSPAGTGELTAPLAVTGSARMHQEYVRGLIVAEGTIAIVSRPVWIRPPASAGGRAGAR